MDLIFKGFNFTLRGSATGLLLLLDTLDEEQDITMSFYDSWGDKSSVQIAPILAPDKHYVANSYCDGGLAFAASYPSRRGFNSTRLSGPVCDIHAVFYDYPTRGSSPFLPLATITDNTILANTRHNWTTSTFPFALARGPNMRPLGCGDGKLNNGEECEIDDIGCSNICNCLYGPPVMATCPRAPVNATVTSYLSTPLPTASNESTSLSQPSQPPTRPRTISKQGIIMAVTIPSAILIFVVFTSCVFLRRLLKSRRTRVPKGISELEGNPIGYTNKWYRSILEIFGKQINAELPETPRVELEGSIPWQEKGEDSVVSVTAASEETIAPNKILRRSSI